MNLTWSFWISVSRCAGRRLLPLDLVLVVAELLGDVLRDVDVEAAHGSVRVLQSEAGLVELRFR